MASSYMQKKLKTLATRKKTRKRHIQEVLTHEEGQGCFFHPTSTYDPRWKEPPTPAVSGVIKSKRQKKAEKKRRKLALYQNRDNKKDDVIKVASQETASSDDELEEEMVDHDSLFQRLKTPLWLINSKEGAVSKAIAKHADIRRSDSRQKAKVLLLVDSRSLFKLVKKKMNIRSEMIKVKSKRGVGSGKKPEMVYKNTGLVKTPLDRYKGVNKTVLKDYKSGKLSSILAEDSTIYPYTELKVQHVIFVAKHARSAINLDRSLLRNVPLHSFVVDDPSATRVSENELKALQDAYEVFKP